MSPRRSLVAPCLALALAACDRERTPPTAAAASLDAAALDAAGSSAALERPKLRAPNAAAYIPAQCFAKTRADGPGPARNPCYVCHVRALPPNFTSDEELQVNLLLPPAVEHNPWRNWFEPPVARAARTTDEDLLAYVRRSNYFDSTGHLALAEGLAAPPRAWDTDGDGVWEGFRPDVRFVFDERGFDHGADGAPNGWRAFAYYPVPGAFTPANGSADDVLIRLAPAFRQRPDGALDSSLYEVNLAVVEALVTRRDVPIDPTDESVLGVDLDLDGHLGKATRVAYAGAFSPRGPTRMHYVGKAHEEEQAGRLAIAPGLFPLGTEFFHTVRYLDVDANGSVTMAARMKEVRYAKKVRFFDEDALKRLAAADAREQAESPDGTHRVRWLGERGVDNGQGWTLQGFIEDARGDLRPQTREESATCVGCHGGIGATTDSAFSFARKLPPTELARGWFHWSQRGLQGIAEPVRSDGQYEYTLYLREAEGGDDFHDNAEIQSRFFDEKGELRSLEVNRLHGDISRLLLPTAARALDLDRAYRAIVAEQSFVHGRDAVLAPTQNALETVTWGSRTGVARAVAATASLTTRLGARAGSTSSQPR